MIVLINAGSALLGGGKTYVKHLIENIDQEIFSKIVLLAPVGLITSRSPNLEIIELPTRLRNPYLRAAWENLHLNRLALSHKADVIFSLNGVVGNQVPAGIKSVLLLQNVGPIDPTVRFRFQDARGFLRNELLRFMMVRSVQCCDLLITVTDSARNMLTEITGPLRCPTITIHHGLAKKFKVATKVLPRPDVLGGISEYFLYVSDCHAHKGHLNLLRAFAELRKIDPSCGHLVLVGHMDNIYGRTVKEESSRLNLDEHVMMIEIENSDILPSLYLNAKANLIPTICESFSFVLLEAMAAGKPIFATPLPALQEVGGQGFFPCDFRDPSRAARFIANSLRDDNRARGVADAGVARASMFDWTVSARQTWAAIADCVRGDRD